MQTAEKPWSLGLSVVIPVYNEEGSVGELARRLAAVLSGMGLTWEVIFVDDGSRDRTPEIADRLSSTHPAVRAVHHPENRGYGAALATGFLAATKDLVFFADSDGQFTPFTRVSSIVSVPARTGPRGAGSARRP